MTLDIRVSGLSLREILNGAPVISDQINAVCRTLTIPVQSVDGLEVYLGQPTELWYNGKRWFFGFLFKDGGTSNGNVNLTAYDPLYFMGKNPDDWYFKNMTGTQAFTELATRSGVRIASLANTGAVLPNLYYQGKEADKVGIDVIARAKAANGRKFWYRYKPDYGADGLILFERSVPAEVWAFQVGVNLEDASYERSIEETATVVKLVNRETGKVVTQIDQETFKKYGQLVHFEEVDKDQANTMEKRAKELLEQLKRVNTTMQVNGINPDRIIPQLYSGDVIYVEEPRTKIIGGYYIRNITQTFESDNLVRLGFDIQAAPDVPEIQYEDATTPPANSTQGGSGTGVQQEYNPEVTALMKKYAIDEGKA